MELIFIDKGSDLAIIFTDRKLHAEPFRLTAARLFFTGDNW
jgi:hypothetical protein